MDESRYRALMKQTLDRIEKAFEDVDPDVAECNTQFGALTITFADRAKCILSSQPSVRQLWMAVASKGIAMHFNYDEARSAWIDDKTGEIELMTYLKGFLRERTGIDFRLS